MAKNTPVKWGMAANERGAFLLYFGNKSDIWAYFPLETKIRQYKGFPDESGLLKRGKRAQNGRIYPGLLVHHSIVTK